jgi:hypothetical protein
VRVTTLDALIERFGVPRFCKIDVEGFEREVLRGLSRPIPFVSFEFSRELFTDAVDCMKQLAELGPTRFNCSLGESLVLMLAHWDSADRVLSALDAQSDRDLWGDIYVRFM